MAKKHTVAAHNSNIPVVTLFNSDESPKLAVIDVSNIMSLVGLVPVLTRRGSSITRLSEYYCVSPGACFDSNIQDTAGKLINLC